MVSRELFLDAMAHLAAGVAIVTARAADGTPCGMLVTSLRSYSASPPSVLFCAERGTRTHAALVRTQEFGVHLLHRDQASLARSFAVPGADRFAGVAWSWDGQVPALRDALAYLRCARRALFSHADHSIVIGEPASGWAPGARVPQAHPQPAPPGPLVYLARRLDWRLEPPREVA